MIKSRISWFSLLVVFLTITVSCGNEGSKAAKKGSASTVQAEVSISGMTCTGCENTIQTNLLKVEGISEVNASYTEGKATVIFDPSIVDSLKIKEVITSVGYTPVRVTLSEPHPVQ